MQSGVTHVELKALHDHGWSPTQLAREFGLSRTTIYKELASLGPRVYGPRQAPFAFTAAQVIYLEQRLVTCPDMRGTDLHAELRHHYGYQGSYPVFQRHIRPLRPAVVRDPEVRFETHPGVQTQADWAELGLWPLGERMIVLSAMVAILGCSRAPAIRFATDRTRETSLHRVLWCLNDLGGVSRETLTDRDPAFVIGQTSDGSAILAPEWVEQCKLLGMVGRACRPYRAKTKGKVERMIRELKESFIPWLIGQQLPRYPTLADYDAAARLWIETVVLKRMHRTTKRVVGEAWKEERKLLRPIPERVLNLYGSGIVVPMPANRPDPQLRLVGETVEVRDLREYEVAQ
jgi:transposase